MKDISVIIPVYNTPLDKLEKCIESVLKLKNICDIEVLIIDDGSKDYIKRFFKEKFIGEVVYQYKKNGGVSSARNMGLDIATGKFICFVDADDIIVEDAFANLEKFRNFQMVVFDIEVLENNKSNIWKVLKCKQGLVDKKTILVELLSSYMRFYSRYKAQKDEDGVARLNGMFLLIFASLSVVCILCGCVMLGNIRTIFGSGLTDSEYATAKVLMALLVVNLALTFPNSVFTCTITAHERFLFQKFLILIQNICNPLLALPLLIMGYGSIGMVSVTTFLTLFVLVMNIYYSFHNLHSRFCFRGFQVSLLKEMWVFTFFIFINQIIDQINWSVDKFLLGRFAGTTAVAVYGVGGQINSMYIEFSSSVSNVFVPKVNRIVAESGNDRELTKLFTKVGRIQFIILGLILSGFVFGGIPFVKIWAGPEYVDYFLISLFCHHDWLFSEEKWK